MEDKLKPPKNTEKVVKPVIYPEFEQAVKNAAVRLYGHTLETIAREVNLMKVMPGDELIQKALTVGCEQLARIVACLDSENILGLADTRIDTNLAVLISQAFYTLVTNRDFGEYHIPYDHVPEGFKEGLPVESEGLNIALNGKASTPSEKSDNVQRAIVTTKAGSEKILLTN